MGLHCQGNRTIIIWGLSRGPYRFERVPTFAPERVGFDATTFEAVSDGDASYMRSSDGKVGKAQADGTQDEALVVGFADDDAAIDATVKVLVAGLLDYPSAIDPGDVYFLSTTAGEISTTAPSTAGQYVTRVVEGATTTEFSIQIEPPILVLMSGTTDHRPYAPNL